MTRNPIELKSCCCQGSLNPLIRSVQQLRQIVGSDGEFREAARQCAIHLKRNTENWSLRPDSELCGVVQEFLNHRAEPSWKRRQELLPGARTTAQLLATHGNTECRAHCEDLQDLLVCLRLVGDCDFFVPSKAVSAFE